MSLKLIDKELKSKYAEALYKNEASYDKEIDRRVERLKIDYTRSSNQVEAGSQIFLNKVRQKRSKWIQDDIKYRDYYRLVCRNVQNKKLDNLKSYFDKSVPSTNRNLDAAEQLRFKLLQDQLKQKEMNLTFINASEPTLMKRKRISQINAKASTNVRKPSQQTLVLEKTELELNVGGGDQQAKTDQQRKQSQFQPQEQPIVLPPIVNPRVPKLDLKTKQKISDDFHDLYSRYSQSDREFIEKFPAKVELTVTDVGKQFITNEKRKHLSIKRNIQNFNRIQENALNDQRYKNLVSYLVSD